MKKEELARRLNGREYREEITKEEEKLAEENQLVVVFCHSDDLMEFRGAINDELGAYGGVNAFVDGNGLLENKCNHDCPFFDEKTKSAKRITSVWCPNNEDEDGNVSVIASWEIRTSIPHSVFEIFEDGVLYCIGLVFSLDDIEEIKSPWIRFDEREPVNGDWVDIFTPYNGRCVNYEYEGDGLFYNNDIDDTKEANPYPLTKESAVTHWMKIPSNPS